LPLSTLNQYYATSSPSDPRNLELSLRDANAKGCLDFELVWSLRQKEAVRDVEKEIADRIENPLEEGTPLFQRVFEEFPSFANGFYLTLQDKRKTHPRGRRWVLGDGLKNT
jgi:hypothetical protein